MSSELCGATRVNWVLREVKVFRSRGAMNGVAAVMRKRA